MPAARALYSQTITYTDSTGVLRPLNNAQVTVYRAGTTDKPPIYAARSTSNATQVANPFITPASGLAEFWAEQGQLDVVVADLNAPARVATRTFGWDSMPAAVGGIAGNSVAADGTLPGAAVADLGIANAKLANVTVMDDKIAVNAAIAKTKLAALNIVNADVASNAGIVRSKLGALDIANADIVSNAAIAKTKLAALNIVDADVTGPISKGKLGALSIVDADISGPISKSKLGSLGIVDADVVGPISKSKLGALNIGDADIAGPISKSKLGTLGIVNSDVAAGAAIEETKLALAADAAYNVASRRTLGTGANQAAQGSVVAAHHALTQTAHIVPRVVSLPPTGTDGEVIDLQTTEMANRGITWRFKFRSGQTYPWEFIGGGAWYDRWPEQVTLPGIAAGGLPTSLSPVRSVAVPGTGTYEVHFKGRLWPGSGFVSQEAILCPMGVEAFNRDEAINGIWSDSNNNPASFSYPWVSFKIVTASSTIEYKGGAPGSPEWVATNLAWSLKPIRLART